MRETIESLRERASGAAIALRESVRRLVASVTEGSAWQLLGYTMADGSRESVRVELFQHVGFASRPAGTAEVVVVNVGGRSEHPIIVATRDSSVQAALAPDETAILTSKATVKITADGNIIVCAASGGVVTVDDGSGAAALATKADLDALAVMVGSHTHPVPGVSTGVGATVSAPPSAAPPAAAGTLVLRAK